MMRYRIKNTITGGYLTYTIQEEYNTYTVDNLGWPLYDWKDVHFYMKKEDADKALRHLNGDVV